MERVGLRNQVRLTERCSSDGRIGVADCAGRFVDGNIAWPTSAARWVGDPPRECRRNIASPRRQQLASAAHAPTMDRSMCGAAAMEGAKVDAALTLPLESAPANNAEIAGLVVVLLTGEDNSVGCRASAPIAGNRIRSTATANFTINLCTAPLPSLGRSFLLDGSRRVLASRRSAGIF